MKGETSTNDTEKWSKLTHDQRLAVVNKYFGLVSAADGLEAATAADFPYDDQGMPGSAD